MRAFLALLALVSTPAFAVDLSVSGVAEPGTTLTLTVTGAAPGQTVWIGASTAQADDVCPPVLGGQCLGLAAPKLAGTGKADASGQLVRTVTVPRTPDGTVVYFQAGAALGGAPPSVSTVVTKYNPYSTLANPTGLGDANFLYAQVLQTTSATDAIGFEVAQFTQPSLGLDSCVLVADMVGFAPTSFAPCPACEISWELARPSGASAPPVAGDCLALFGYDASLFTGVFGNAGTGFDTDYAGIPGYTVGWGYVSGTGWVPYAGAYFDAVSGYGYWAYSNSFTY